MLKLKTLNLLLIGSFLATASCKTITIYNAEVCGDLGIHGAHCSNTLIDDKRDIAKEAWDLERVGMLCMNAQAFTDTENAIDQFCTIKKKLCTYETREELRASFLRINNLIESIHGRN